MSLINDITNAVGIRSTYGSTGQQPTLAAGQQPGGPSLGEQLRSRFGSTVSTEFDSNIANVLTRGSSGEWEDPTLALEEQAALQRLRIAREQAGPGAATGGGSNAAPTPGEAPAPQGSNAAPDANALAVAEERNLYAVRVRQSEARLKNISSSLAADFPLASQLAPASAGAWDAETFVPQTREQAMAFAHRLVIDATEGAARLEIIKTQLDAARFEYEQTGSDAAKQELARLMPAFDRQKAYVDKLARVVDQQSGGQVSAAGTDAMAGTTQRTAADLPVDEIAATLRAEGMSEAQIARVVGAGEMAVDQDRGDGKLVKGVADEVTRNLINQFNARLERMREDGRRKEQVRADERRLEDQRSDRKRTEQRAQQQRTDQRRTEQQLQAQVQAQRAAQADAEFQRWIASLAQRSAAS